MEDEEKAAKAKQIELLDTLQMTNNELTNAIIKQKIFFRMNLNRVHSRMLRSLNEVTNASNALQRREVANRVSNELKNILIVQQKTALKRQLARLDAQYNALKAELDKEVCCLKEK